MSDDALGVCRRFATSTRPLIEALEARQLLTVYTYAVPAGVAAAYLQMTETPGQVQVRLHAADGPVAYTFANTTGMSVIDCGGNADFLFVDQVPAASKPRSDSSGDNGIKVQGGTRGTLRIEAADHDTLIQIAGGSVISTPVEVTDNSGQVGRTRLGSGLRHLHIVTNGVRATDYHPNGGTDVIVTSLPASYTLRIDTGMATFARVTVRQAAATTIKTGAGHNIVTLQENIAGGVAASVDFGAGIGPGNGLGLGNVLNIHGVNHSAGLRPIDGTHVVVVDEVNVFSRGALIVYSASKVGLVKVASQGVLAVQAPLEADYLEVDGIADFTGTSAPSTIGQFRDSNGTVNVLQDADVTVLESSNINVVNVSGVSDYAYLQFQTAASHVKTLHIGLGKVTLLESSARPSGTPQALIVDDLQMPLHWAFLDLTDNGLIVNYTVDTPLTALRGLIVNSYAGGAWNGLVGIGSSIARGRTDSGVGYAEASELFASFPAVFLDRSIDERSALLRYTYYGDANLDGIVNLHDFNRLAAHFGQSGAQWVHGDSDYNGTVGWNDFNHLAANFGRTIAGMPNWSRFSIEHTEDDLDHLR